MDTFVSVKKQVQDKFDTLIKDQQALYTVQVDREKIWDLYLLGFSDPIVRQGYNCNCCKSFLRQFAGIVTIKNNIMETMWDIDIDSTHECYQAIQNIKKYIKSLPITDRFYNDYVNLGTNFNKTLEGVTWNHFHVKLPKTFVQNKDRIPSIQGEQRDNKTVLQRSLNELTIDATETILELIGQNSLYRGKEFEGLLTEFLKIQKEYKNVKGEVLKDNFCWVKSASISQALARIRNISIGTLLIDVSNGVNLDQAVGSFERVVAPSNYKRPNAIVTPKMVEEAKKKLEELGYMDSLERRFATPEDVDINNVLFVDKSTSITDVFKEMASDVTVNPKSLSKIEEVTIEDFILNVLPTSKKVEILFENNQTNNLVSLITASNKDSKTMFKWDNSFSWSYTGGITDSMQEKVKQAGGSLEGLMRFSLKWNENGKDICDLDIHCDSPVGKIFYGNKRHGYNDGFLDVDMIRPKDIGIENVIFKQVKKGEYHFSVNNFDNNRHTGFQCQLEVNGEIYDFTYPKHSTGFIEIVKVFYDGVTFKVTPLLDAKSQVVSKEVWGIKTNQFVKVKEILNSPNYWTNNVGNKHYIFALENCVSDESPRPFFNEFLQEDLLKEKRVFETMAGKLQVSPNPNQISGLGFSETKHQNVIVRVTGNFSRNLKIKF